MKREELKELHYITAIDNIASVLKLGILSNREAQGIEHTSIAMGDIQERRAKVVIPGGRPLHEYVCLYICGRNPMLRKRREQHENICVLQVRDDVLDLAGVVVTNANASSDYVRFAAAPDGLHIVDYDLTFAEWWTDPNPIVEHRKRSAKCAEVLVPDCVDPRYISGCYVSCAQSQVRVTATYPELSVTVDPKLFFL